MSRVAITGMGVVAPNGAGTEAFWSALRSGNSRTEAANATPEVRIRVCEITDASWTDGLNVPHKALDRSALLAVAASGQALAQSGLTKDDAADRTRIGVVMGNGAAGQVTMDQEFKRLYAEKTRRTHPLTVAKSMVSSSASWVSMAHGLRGTAFVVGSACASGTHAIGVAAALIRAGAADAIVTGGTEAPLCFGTIVAWESMRILSPDYCRPFSADRAGLILGEGAGALVLEREDHARARGAEILGYVAGYDSCADAGDIVAPSAEGMERAMRGALRDAGLQPSDIDYVNAHGTGTLSNDKTEAQALVSLFGDGRTPLVSATKSMTGHGLGAAGAIEAVATLLCMRNGFIHPTANHNALDPECPIDCVPNVAREAAIRRAMSNSFAFGGLNATLVFEAA